MGETLLGEIDGDLEKLEPNASMRCSCRQVVGPALLFQERKNGSASFVPNSVSDVACRVDGVVWVLVREGELDFERPEILDWLDISCSL